MAARDTIAGAAEAAIANRSISCEASGATDRGRVRRGNEDALVCQVEAGIFVVCDGMGGAAAGELASLLASETAMSVLIKHKPSAQLMTEAVRLANRVVFTRAQSDRLLEGMGTTLVTLAVHKTTAWIAHVGDSRCYRWRDGRLKCLTHDHSLVEEQVRLGRMTPAQARRSPMQNVITRAIGTRPEVYPDVEELALQTGDVFLLASDGLTRELQDGKIASLLAAAPDLHETCNRLIEAANAAGGRDNITCVLVRVR